MPNEGRRFEQRVARSVPGGHRTPGSGSFGGGDLSFAPGELWRDWSFELKFRSQLPKSIVGWMQQARTDIAIGDPRRPAVVIQEAGGDTLAVFQWSDISQWVAALAEVGNAAKLKSLVRQLNRQVAEIEAAIR